MYMCFQIPKCVQAVRGQLAVAFSYCVDSGGTQGPSFLPLSATVLIWMNNLAEQHQKSIAQMVLYCSDILKR